MYPCQDGNSAEQNFRVECCSRLVAVCGSCGTPNPPAQKFCGECGGPLAPGRLTAASTLAAVLHAPHLAEKILPSKAVL